MEEKKKRSATRPRAQGAGLKAGKPLEHRGASRGEGSAAGKRTGSAEKKSPARYAVEKRGAAGKEDASPVTGANVRKKNGAIGEKENRLLGKQAKRGESSPVKKRRERLPSRRGRAASVWKNRKRRKREP